MIHENSKKYQESPLDPTWTIKPLGRSRKGKNVQVCLQAGALKTWVNPLGCFFHFLKILSFGPWGPGPGP